MYTRFRVNVMEYCGCVAYVGSKATLETVILYIVNLVIPIAAPSS